MKEHLKTMSVTAVLVSGSLALGHAGLLAFPDTGGSGMRQGLQLAALTSPTAPHCQAEGAVREREERLKRSLEALGLAVD